MFMLTKHLDKALEEAIHPGVNGQGQHSRAQAQMYEAYPHFCSSGVSQVALVVKNSPVNAEYLRNTGLIPGLGRSPGGGHGNPL